MICSKDGKRAQNIVFNSFSPKRPFRIECDAGHGFLFPFRQEEKGGSPGPEQRGAPWSWPRSAASGR